MSFVSRRLLFHWLLLFLHTLSFPPVLPLLLPRWQQRPLPSPSIETALRHCLSAAGWPHSSKSALGTGAASEREEGLASKTFAQQQGGTRPAVLQALWSSRPSHTTNNSPSQPASHCLPRVPSNGWNSKQIVVLRDSNSRSFTRSAVFVAVGQKWKTGMDVAVDVVAAGLHRRTAPERFGRARWAFVKTDEMYKSWVNGQTIIELLAAFPELGFSNSGLCRCIVKAGNWFDTTNWCREEYTTIRQWIFYGCYYCSRQFKTDEFQSW